ncbi:hypothetical protein M153_2230002210 [Pseudoloma neurophilia]|uniref:Uncharacterized protein n=1 Tax=Pseudoloma neurophilia TaxID=146866 RepID=A0A0R0LYW0_9MICR|nr:hypothetical protein M153_2230002210 [Pseudoloma neurophilia]
MTKSHLFVLAVLMNKKITLKDIDSNDQEFIEFLEVCVPGTYIDKLENGIVEFVPGVPLNKKHIQFNFTIEIHQFLDAILILCSFLEIEMDIIGLDTKNQRKLKSEQKNQTDEQNCYTSEIYHILPKLKVLSLFGVKIDYKIYHISDWQPKIKLNLINSQPVKNLHSTTLKNNPKRIFAHLFNHEDNKYLSRGILNWLKEKIEHIKVDVEWQEPREKNGQNSNHKKSNNDKNDIESEMLQKRRGVTCIFSCDYIFRCFTITKLNTDILQAEMTELFKEVLIQTIDDELLKIFLLAASLAIDTSNCEILESDISVLKEIGSILEVKWKLNNGKLAVKGINFQFE